MIMVYLFLGKKKEQKCARAHLALTHCHGCQAISINRLSAWASYLYILRSLNQITELKKKKKKIVNKIWAASSRLLAATLQRHCWYVLFAVLSSKARLMMLRRKIEKLKKIVVTSIKVHCTGHNRRGG
jgi:hypothetical protein